VKDLTKVALPLQVGGFAAMAIGFMHVHVLQAGFIVHLVGDVLFYLQMKRQGCI
jgi:hypothetical protein